MDKEKYERIDKALDEILRELNELKQLLNTKGNKQSPTKITIIGNRPQKTMKVKGISSEEDFEL